jgi:hypothetical protein
MKIIFAVFASIFFLATPSIYACSCMYSDPPAAFNGSELVFIGRMMGGTEKFSTTYNNVTTELEAGKVRFEILELFKGNGSIATEVTTDVASMRGTSCGDYGLKPSVTYVVYAYSNEKSTTLYTGVCTRTGQVDSENVKTEDLLFLRNLPAKGAGGNIRGRLWVDARKVHGGGAEPLANVTVSIKGADGKILVAKTGNKGEFEFKNIPSGKYRVEPHLPANYFIEDDSGNPFREIEVADRGTADVGMEAYFTGRVEGKVIDANGVGFDSTFLHLESVIEDDDQRQVYGHSDGENGKFSFEGVPPGEYFVFLELQHRDVGKEKKYYYPGTFVKAEATKVNVGLGKTVKGLVFTLPKEFQIRTIEGQVFWDNGLPAGNVEVLLLCPKRTANDGFIVEFGPTGAQTNKDGMFTLQGFTGNTYWLQALGSLEEKNFESGTKKIELTDNVVKMKVRFTKDSPAAVCGEDPTRDLPTER